VPREAVADGPLEGPVTDALSVQSLPVGTQNDQDAAVSPRPAGRRRRGSRRMLRPDGHSHYRALAVADVDLDRRVATLVPPVTAYEHPPEGVHALVWFHGHPIGELTLPGDPATLLPALPRVAARELAQAVDEHRFRDALATSGGLTQATEKGLASISHPDEALDGTGITVAVCTRDRPDDLRRCLAAVEMLDPAPAAVLVVDNASVDDRTRQVAAEYGVGYVREPRAGLDWARNRALLEATTPVVAFTDDDVVVHPGWMAGIARAFREEPDAVAVTGLVAPAELATPAQVLFEAYGGFGRGYSRQWMSVAVEGGEVAAQIYPGTGGAGTGANMALLRDEALALGGFDPALDVGTPTGGGGDLEMYFRVLAAGHLLVYEPTAVVRHVHRRTGAELLRQVRGHGTGLYSIYAGAALAYGALQARELVLFGLRWALQRHARAHVGQLLGRRRLPWALDRAETRGMLAAVRGRYYVRGRRQAARQEQQHPDEPQPPALLRPRARRTRSRVRDRVITADPTRGVTGTALRGDPGAPLARLRVERDGWPVTDLVFRAGGKDVSPARLRWELVRHLGPALLVPGRAWRDWQADTMGADGVHSHMRLRPEFVTAHQDDSTRVVLVRPGAGETAGRQAPGALPGEVESAGAGLSTAMPRTEPGPEVTRQLDGIDSVARLDPAILSPADVVVLLRGGLDVTPNWLGELLAPFSDPAVSVVTGNVLPANAERPDEQLWDHHGLRDRGPHRASFDRDWLRASRGPARLWDIGTLANAALRGSALAHLAGLTDGSDPTGAVFSEDFFYRVLRGGGRIVYQPSAVALRPPRTSDRGVLCAEVATAAAAHVASLLNVVVVHRDLRGLLRLGIVLPPQRVRRLWHWLRGGDDVPGDLLLADLTGLVRGLAWWRWRGR
jgi:GT2 family glycosyltransferase